jgi:hypothetical protein
MQAVIKRSRLPAIISTGLKPLLIVATNTYRLAKVAVTPNPDLPASQFTEADFTGYAAIAAPLFATGPFITPSGLGEIQDGVKTWAPSGVIIQNIIYAVYMTDVGGDWIVAWQFAAGYPMGSLTDLLSIVPVVNMSVGGIQGSVEPITM